METVVRSRGRALVEHRAGRGTALHRRGSRCVAGCDGREASEFWNTTAPGGREPSGWELQDLPAGRKVPLQALIDRTFPGFVVAYFTQVSMSFRRRSNRSVLK